MSGPGFVNLTLEDALIAAAADEVRPDGRLGVPAAVEPRTAVAELDATGLLRVSDGALCAFPAGFTGRGGEPLPLIVRKGDGGFGYADATAGAGSARHHRSAPDGTGRDGRR